MPDIKIKCVSGGAGMLEVDGHDLSNFVLRDSIVLDGSGDMWVVHVTLAGNIEADVPDALLITAQGRADDAAEMARQTNAQLTELRETLDGMAAKVGAAVGGIRYGKRGGA